MTTAAPKSATAPQLLVKNLTLATWAKVGSGWKPDLRRRQGEERGEPKPDPHYRVALRLCRDDHRRIASYAISPRVPGSISTIST